MPRQRLNDLTGKEWVKATKSWFVINPKPRTQRQIQHPAKYPEELVLKFLRFFTRVDDWVLDPFAGVGSTLAACKSIDRNAVGIELNPKYVVLAENLLSRVDGLGKWLMLQGDAVNACDIIRNAGEIHRNFDFLMTSPPYWNMLRKSRGGNDSTHKEREASNLDLFYSDDARDLGNIDDYNAYIEQIGKVFDSVSELLRDEAYLVVVAQNMRDVNGEMKPIAWDLARRISNTYSLKQEMIWCQDNKRLGCWGYPTTYVSNVHHHYCLVFQK